LSDGKTANVSDLLTSEEKTKCIREFGKEQPINYISRHPEFWNEERIKREAWRFESVATTFGITRLKDSDGNALNLNLLDVDSEQAFTGTRTMYLNVLLILL
jgi:hypothetical protein